MVCKYRCEGIFFLMYECEVHDVKIVYYVVLSFLYICPYVLFRTALFNKDKVQYDQSPEFKFRFVFSPLQLLRFSALCGQIWQKVLRDF